MATKENPNLAESGPFLAETPRQLEVLRIIRDHGPITRSEIAARMLSSASQISRLTAPLIIRRVVTVEPRLPHVEGRPTELLALAKDTHYVIGLDVGGSAQDAVVTNLRGDVVGCAHVSGSSPTSRSSIITHLVQLVDTAIESAGIPREQILGVGAGVRAIIDPVSGVISAGPETPSWSPEWVGFDMRDQLKKALSWPRFVIDDTVRALAAAECRYGSARGFDDYVYVVADSGIGAALIIEGHPYIGPGHLAGEVGHITLDRNGPLCSCGRRGCVEMFASTSAMIARGHQTDPAITTLENMIERAEAGDAIFRDILAAGGGALGRAIAILLNLLNPALIVVGGRATSSTLYMENVRASARIEALGQPFRYARIATSEVREHSGAQGAATLMLNELFGVDVSRSIVRRNNMQPSAAWNHAIEQGEAT